MTGIIRNFLLIQIYSVITCGNLKAPEHGRISCSNRDRYDSKCSYECDTGYELIGAQVIFYFFFARNFWAYIEPAWAFREKIGLILAKVGVWYHGQQCDFSNCQIPGYSQSFNGF